MARFFGMGKESTYGTQVSLSAYVNMIEESIKADNSIDADPTVGQRFKEKPIPGSFKVGGGMKCYLEQENIGLLLLSLMGASSDAYSLTEAGVGLHTFTPKDASQSLTAAVGTDVTAGQKSVPGAIARKLKVSLAPKGKILLDWDFIGKTLLIDSLATPTFSVKPAYHNAHAVCKLGGSQIARIKAMTMEIAGDVTDDDFVHGSRMLYGLNNAGMTVKGSMDLLFDAIDQMKMFMGSSSSLSPQVVLVPQALALEITGETKIGATQYPFIKFLCGEVVFTTHKASISKRERTIENIDWECFVPAAGGNPFSILYQNTVLAAY